jgi:hypothetical protein
MAREVKEMTGNKDKAYKFPETEAGYVHAEVVLKQFDRNTGKPLTKAYVQKYEPRGWENFVRRPNGFTVEKVLHLPEGAKSVEQIHAQMKKEREAKERRIRKSQ